MEVWKLVDGYTSYMISNYGNIKSIDRTVVGKNGVAQRRTSKILKKVVDNTGYYVVTLHEQGVTKNHCIHVLVGIAFVCGQEPNLVINHIDGNKLNCVYTNLEWTTRKVNNQHAIETGLHNCRGENSSVAKLSNADVLYIRKVYTPRCSLYGGKALAEQFGVSAWTISAIIQNKHRKFG